MSKLKQAPRWWYQPLKWYVFPLVLCSGLYRMVMVVRRCFFALKKSKKFPVPLIIVGNITVGGTGKTPVVAWLVRQLQQRGYQPGIVSRGYGGQSRHYPKIVDVHSTPDEVGDEALMLHVQTQCPVVVDPRRRRAVEHLLAMYPCDVIISDDGLQHLDLARDIEIVVVDGQRRWGNGFCLPAGPLREPVSRCRRADFVIVHGAAPVVNAGDLLIQYMPSALVRICDGERIDVTNSARCVLDKKIHAVAAIGNPEQFFQTLEKWLPHHSLIRHVFPDHHRYVWNDFDFLSDAAEEAIVIMTEKDAIKCRDFADRRFYFLPIDVVCAPDQLFLFQETLMAQLAAR